LPLLEPTWSRSGHKRRDVSGPRRGSPVRTRRLGTLALASSPVPLLLGETPGPPVGSNLSLGEKDLERGSRSPPRSVEGPPAVRYGPLPHLRPRPKGQSNPFQNVVKAVKRPDRPNPAKGREKLSSLYERWVARAASTNKPAERTLIACDEVWRRYIEPRIGSRRLDSLTKADCQAVVDGASTAWRAVDTLLIAAVVRRGGRMHQPKPGHEAPHTSDTAGAATGTDHG
jgi:hypothetical protein